MVNLCISPSSIETALAMTAEGADGETAAEMNRGLRLPNGTNNGRESFAELRNALELIASSSSPKEPIALAVANRLFAQNGYQFRREFLEVTKQFIALRWNRLISRATPPARRNRSTPGSRSRRAIGFAI